MQNNLLRNLGLSCLLNLLFIASFMIGPLPPTWAKGEDTTPSPVLNTTTSLNSVSSVQVVPAIQPPDSTQQDSTMQAAIGTTSSSTLSVSTTSSQLQDPTSASLGVGPLSEPTLATSPEASPSPAPAQSLAQTPIINGQMPVLGQGQPRQQPLTREEAEALLPILAWRIEVNEGVDPNDPDYRRALEFYGGDIGRLNDALSAASRQHETLDVNYNRDTRTYRITIPGLTYRYTVIRFRGISRVVETSDVPIIIQIERGVSTPDNPNGDLGVSISLIQRNGDGTEEVLRDISLDRLRLNGEVLGFLPQVSFPTDGGVPILELRGPNRRPNADHLNAEGFYRASPLYLTIPLPDLIRMMQRRVPQDLPPLAFPQGLLPSEYMEGVRPGAPLPPVRVGPRLGEPPPPVPDDDLEESTEAGGVTDSAMLAQPGTDRNVS